MNKLLKIGLGVVAASGWGVALLSVSNALPGTVEAGTNSVMKCDSSTGVCVNSEPAPVVEETPAPQSVEAPVVEVPQVQSTQQQGNVCY